MNLPRHHSSFPAKLIILFAMTWLGGVYALANEPISIEVDRSCFCQGINERGEAVNEFTAGSAHSVPVSVYLRLTLNEACSQYLDMTHFLQLQVYIKKVGDWGAQPINLTIEPQEWEHQRAKAVIEINGDQQPGYFHWRWPVVYRGLAPGDYIFYVIGTDGNRLRWFNGDTFESKITIKE